jgi:riboflavin kinase/FMN adenylyltransferase
MQILRRFALDRVLCVQFNQNFASMNAEDFIHNILIAKLDVKYLGIGDDFKFGKQRLGDFKMLSHAGKEHGFQVASMHSFIIDGERVSSTRIRDALINGHFDLAEKLLGRPYRMCGRVAHGDKRGRLLGFPTANIYVHRKLTPVSGVFAVEMFGLHGEPLAGVANVGIRPTVNGKKCILEVHLLNYNNDIYGKYVHVNFLKKLRSEIRFDSIEELKHQIEQDKVEAERFFTNRK